MQFSEPKNVALLHKKSFFSSKSKTTVFQFEIIFKKVPKNKVFCK